MKAMKKVFAMLLALAMIVTAVPVADASAATYNMKAGSTISKSLYAGRSHTLKLSGLKASKVESTKWTVGKETVVKLTSTGKTKAIIKLVGKGYTIVTAKVTLTNKKTKTYKAKITVKNPSITVDKENMTINLGSYDYINVVSYKPSNATVTYTSRNEAIATVVGGKVTGTGIGTTEIVTSVVCGTKKISKLTTVTVEPGADGLTLLGLSNPISEDYPNTVWVNDQACIRALCVRDGRPVAGENLVITKKTTTSSGTQADGLNYAFNALAATAVTDANGIATFVVGYNRDTIKATDTSLVGHYDFTISLASDINTKAEGTVDFAAIELGTVRNQNRLESWEGRPDDINKIVPSTNDYKATKVADKGDGYTTTQTAATQRVKNGAIVYGQNVEYVDSQQVSATGGTDNQVAFDNYTPHILLPTAATDLTSATAYQQDVNISSGAYHVYRSASEGQVITLNVNPSELTYATLNFSKLQLSAHTKLVIRCYNSAYAASIGATTWGFFNSEEILGPVDMSAHSYQIPLRSSNTNTDVAIRLEIVSQGQVDTDMNAGYEVKDITGVYRTVDQGGTKTIALKDANVEWSIDTAPMSNVKTLTATENANILATSGINLLAKYAKVTYQVPVFPYTGNAVLTCYDANNNVKTYFVCPTVNRALLEQAWQSACNATNIATVNAASTVDDIPNFMQSAVMNENLLDIYSVMTNAWTTWHAPAAYCYEVSYEEATKQVGSISSQDSTRVIVNSDKVGVTSLKGKVTLGGTEIAALDETNNTLYTSVQWCPKADATTVDNEFALVGQKVTAVAQVLDANGNPVNISGLDIAFHWGTRVEYLDRTVGRIYLGGLYGINDSVTALRVDNKTNKDGQATIVLQAALEDNLTGFYAVESSGRYRVKISFKNGESHTVVKNLAWLDPELRFTRSANEDPLVFAQTSGTNPVISTDALGVTGVTPMVGTNWEYGFETYAWFGREGDVGETANWVKITGLGIGMTKDANTVGTISGAGNGIVTATSTKAGQMDIIGTLDRTSSTTDVVIGGKKGVGEGVADIYKKLTLNVHWTKDGISGEFLTVNGSRIYDVPDEDEYVDVYFQAKDKNENAYNNVRVYFTKEDVVQARAAGTVIEYFGVDGVDYGETSYGHYVLTDANGIAHIRLWHGNDTRTTATIITTWIDVPEIRNESFVQTYTWVNSATVVADQRLEIEDKKLADGTYQSVYDEATGVLKITFKSNLVDTSLINDNKMIKATYHKLTGTPDTIELVIGKMEIHRNVIELTFNNKAGIVSGGDNYFEIEIKGEHEDDDLGLIRSLTSVNGESYKRGATIRVYLDPKDTETSHVPTVTIPEEPEEEVLTLATAAEAMDEASTVKNNVITLPTEVTVADTKVTIKYSVVVTGGGILADTSLTEDTDEKIATAIRKGTEGDNNYKGAGIAVIKAVFTEEGETTPLGTKYLVVRATSEGFMPIYMYDDVFASKVADMVDVGAFAGVVTGSAANIVGSTAIGVAAIASDAGASCELVAVGVDGVLQRNTSTGDLDAINAGTTTVQVNITKGDVTVTVTYTVVVDSTFKIESIKVTNVELVNPAPPTTT